MPVAVIGVTARIPAVLSETTGSMRVIRAAVKLREKEMVPAFDPLAVELLGGATLLATDQFTVTLSGTDMMAVAAVLKPVGVAPVTVTVQLGSVPEVMVTTLCGLAIGKLAVMFWLGLLAVPFCRLCVPVANVRVAATLGCAVDEVVGGELGE